MWTVSRLILRGGAQTTQNVQGLGGVFENSSDDEIGEEATREVLPGKGEAVHQRDRLHPQRARSDARRHQLTSHIVSKSYVKIWILMEDGAI